MEKAISILAKHIQESKKHSIYPEVKNQFDDTLKVWSQKNRNHGFYKNKSYDIHTLIFNRDYDRVLIIVYKEKERKNVAFNDMFSGYKKEGQWHFISNGVPKFGLDISEVADQIGDPKTYSIQNVYQNLINDGLVRRGRVRAPYFEKWLE